MTATFTKLSDTDLQALIAALRSGRVESPFSAIQVSRVVPQTLSATIREALVALDTQGFTSQQVATVLELIASDRSGARITEPPIDLVTSGPEAPGITNRETAVVVRELFRARTEVGSGCGIRGLPGPAGI